MINTDQAFSTSVDTSYKLYKKSNIVDIIETTVPMKDTIGITTASYTVIADGIYASC